jgi:hypothetical protein
MALKTGSMVRAATKHGQPTLRQRTNIREFFCDRWRRSLFPLELDGNSVVHAEVDLPNGMYADQIRGEKRRHKKRKGTDTS